MQYIAKPLGAWLPHIIKASARRAADIRMDDRFDYIQVL